MKIYKINKYIKITFFIKFLFFSFSQPSFSKAHNFNQWLNNFKKEAINYGISEKVVNEIMLNVKFLPKVIEYDRFQPEFYEDTFTYIKKRTSKKKIKDGLRLYKKEKLTIDKVENEFQVEKELLLALIGIETNFGKYLGKWILFLH